ncbi:MFS transporter [Kaistella flava (ex Peng et al. 2021)]|uniref:MFS transporter n=1 Tax=Kaistella flava (ex Peng et al. 2021) TaxID=2038776 RepID=A0A7M2Y6A2_9FLAO|nr:MFS transporter [Kaistella flava (ex Peng et al. 2021)]QOW08962.1 MFS transporter [Kaistella flava (ex Peng et al. 2021)]
MKNKLPNSLLYLLSVSAGLVVANLYYNQPLLHDIASSLQVKDAEVSNVALSTQIGYALGLLFIIPLGDKVSNLKIIRLNFLILVLSLMGAALSQSLPLLIFSSFLIGFTSTLPQLFVPMVAHLSSDEGRGRAIGIVMSGLLIGILGSRVLSGLVGEYFGWRSVFFGAAGLMTMLFFLLNAKLPVIQPKFGESYAKLMKSLWFYFKTEPTLRLATLRGALAFGSLSAFWTTFVFLMQDSFGYGSAVAGGFGLFGIAGALGATVVGKLNNRVKKSKLIIFGTILIIASWLIFLVSPHSIIGLIIGVVLIDLGVQGVHITNQNIVFSKNTEARNRVNTIYMVGFFIGGAAGTSFGSLAWNYFGWTGVSVVGLVFSGIILIVQLLTNKKTI